MCGNRYRKVKSLFEDTSTCVIGVTSKSVCTQTQSDSVSTETQTLPALPIKNKK